ncbi:RNA-directed DNA polymerase, eukaryota, reverse transcriptase zinc-binding domain protein [Tanacetum coccineum]
MRSHIMNQSTVTVLTPFRWNRLLPIKVNILCWRIISLRLPRRLSLDYRGVDLDSVRYPICDNDIENEEHLFVHCDVSINTWARVLQWWGSQVMEFRASQRFSTFQDELTYPPIIFVTLIQWLEQPFGCYRGLETAPLSTLNSLPKTLFSTNQAIFLYLGF